MSVYLIAQIEIHDRNEYNQYEAGFLEIFSKYKGEILAVEEDPNLLEGEWPYTRTVLIRFPDEDETMRWYKSDEYQMLAQHRFKSSRANLILAKGFEG